jgi:hypothetical protein
LRLQVVCFCKTARGFPVTLQSQTERSLAFCTLVTFCADPFRLCSVFAWAASLANCVPLNVASAFAAAPFARFAFSGEPHSAQNHAALFANFTSVHSMLCEQCFGLLNGQLHGSFSTLSPLQFGKADNPTPHRVKVSNRLPLFSSCHALLIFALCRLTALTRSHLAQRVRLDSSKTMNRFGQSRHCSSFIIVPMGCR